jgi:hypothetical protein
MAFSIVHHAVAGALTTTITAPATGNCLIVLATWDNTTTGTPTCTDNKSNVYNLIDAVADSTNSQCAAAFVLGNVTNGPTTVTVGTNASESPGISVIEVSGVLATSNPLDGHAAQVQKSLSTGAPTSGSFTTGAGGDFILGASFNTNDTTTYTAAGSGFTLIDNTATTAAPLASEWQTQASAGSVASTFSISATSRNYLTFCFALKAAGNSAVALAAKGMAAAVGRITFAGRTSLSASGAAQATSRAGIGGLTGLAARGSSAAKGTAITDRTATLTAKSLAAGFGQSGVSARAALFATGAALAKGGLTFSGHIALGARGTAVSFGKMVPPGAVALIARGFAMATSRAAVTGRVALQAGGQAQAKATAAIRANIFLAAAARAMASGRAGISAGAALSARATPASFGRARLAAKAALSASGAAMAKGVTTPAARVALAARGVAQASGRAILGGITPPLSLSASGFAKAAGRAWLFVFGPSARVGKTKPQGRSAAAPFRSRTVVALPRDNTADAPPST